MLGLTGVISTFALFYVAENHFHINREIIQPLIYLKLSVAGHLTVFVARTRGPFWSHRPATILLVAVILTQLAATFISVYGILMPPLGWTYAIAIWIYAFIWFIINDRVKLFAYSIFEKPQSATFPKAVKS